MIEMLPDDVKDLLGLVDAGSTLTVLRNLRLLDVCAGKARICRRANMLNIKGIAIDRDY